MKFLGLIPQNFLGIDIGTFSIKAVEMSSWAGRKKLENYGEISASVLYKEPFRTFNKDTLSLSSKDIARAIKAVIDESKMKSKKVAFSIPDFSTFFTTIDLPPMTIEEIPQAVRAEARRHVPLPLAEVTLDWQILEKPTENKMGKVKVLLVTVPNEIINQYQRIAAELGFELMALEAEVFGLARALIPKDEKETVSLIDIGARSTTCSIISKQALNISRSFDLSGNSLTERIAKGLSIDYEKAEEVKKEYGILFSQKSNTRDILVPLIDLIINEIEKVFKSFYLKEKKEVKKIIISGGTAFLPGLVEYFQKHFPQKDIEIANPFLNIFFPPILEQTLKEIGSSYAIAVGMALRGLD